MQKIIASFDLRHNHGELLNVCMVKIHIDPDYPAVACIIVQLLTRAYLRHNYGESLNVCMIKIHINLEYPAVACIIVQLLNS